ncbi:ShlB/FhaC/HecB family hemolysin secretion/activation protein [Sphingomonas sp. CA1-15]|uniref:ShlB/FhaC/HecB family hemolysin secretion/activation protein n=2 Tax=Sphingomonas immobilis TaxID=3063997 RepID=A0ABT8ZWD8_9SPHN|nr:ShlB/FhaC/HecB family hemolysin secretion/activation protein [Sphingomonas sp. CA1-15]
MLLAAALVAPAIARAQSAPPVQRLDTGVLVRETKPEVPSEALPRPEIETPARAAEPVAVAPGVMVGAIMIDGGEELSRAELMTAVSSFIGHRLNTASMQDLLAAVSGVARAHGYIFARSSIPAQTISAGVLHVGLDLGRIGEIRGATGKDGEVLSALAPLIGHAPMQAELERRLMLAGDLPGVSIGRVRFVREGTRGILIVPVTRKRVQGLATVDNRGLDALGPVRAQISVDVSQLLMEDDRIGMQVVTTPLEPRELFALYGRYEIHPTASGTEVAFYGSYGRTHSGGRWSAFDPEGESFSAGMSITQPIFRGRRESFWASVQFNHVETDSWWAGALSQRDRITTIGASINGYAPFAGGRLRAGAGVNQGVLALGAMGPNNPLASRFAAGSDFTVFNFWANWVGDIAGPVSARLAVTAQASTNPLPAVQQISIGGPYFGRGYDFSERMGDEGVLGSAELRAKVVDKSSGLVRWTQVYAFADGSHVRSLRNDFGTGDLYSAGAGARLTLAENLGVELEAAFPINSVRYDSGNKSPRVSFSVNKRF